MKKFISILLVLVSVACVCAVGLAGCGDKDEFVEVYSVSYSNGSEITKITSTFTLHYGEETEISYEEYLAVGIYSNDMWELLSTINFAADGRSITVPFGTFVARQGAQGYYKKAIVSVSFQMVEIKKTSDRDIVIKENGKTKQVMSDNIVIEYFG